MSILDRDRLKVLIVDDNAMNRNILSEMLGDEYIILEAENGAEAVAILQKESVNISLVLLDIVMPVMDGYEVLNIMNSKGWIKDIPVIMISSDDSVSSMRRAYELGITEFISRSFDALIVRHRVVNTIMLYAKQKKLVGMVADQIYEKEKESSLMINILSHIVEFRNGESGLHVLHVQQFTKLLLRHLIRITDKYDISESDIALIAKASALHDIGKISVPDHILNKPGRLTDEEFAVMKSHSLAGASLLDELATYKDEPLVKVAYQICRWHHERFDGRGYPDGLVGEEIPISAQIVALADVYDALTSERVYKKAFSHEKAMNMILNGECGQFNPLLLECLQQASDDICDELKKPVSSDVIAKANISPELMQYDELSASEETIRLLEHEKMKSSFYASLSENLNFEYTSVPPMLTINPNNSGLFENDILINDPLENEELFSIISRDDLEHIVESIRNTSPKDSAVRVNCRITAKNKLHNVEIICKALWDFDNSERICGVIGKVVDMRKAD